MSRFILPLVAVITLFLAPLGKTAPAASLSGKWHFVLDTPGGDREMDSILELNEDKVTGRWDVTDAKRGEPISGTFTDNQLTLEFDITSEEAGPGKMKIKGKLDDNGALIGDWAFQDYSGTFKATRAPADAAPKS